MSTITAAPFVSTATLKVPRWLPVVAIFVLAAGLRAVLVTHPDVSWGLTMAEKFLDGQRLYVDIMEPNPPATMFLYVAPAWLAGVTGLRGEFMVGALGLLAAALSLWLAGGIVVRTKLIGDRDGWLLATIAAAALTVLPAATFGEREHVGLIALLPFLATNAARAADRQPDWLPAIVAGIGAGVAIVVKPHFALAAVAAAAASALCARSWRPLFAIEHWAAGVVAVAYGAWVFLAYPRFISDMLPLVVAVYVPVKAELWPFVVRFAIPLWLAAWALIVWLQRRARAEPPIAVLFAASLGCVVGYYLQRKGWAYQSYPMLALALMALAIAFADRWHGGPISAAEIPHNRWMRLATAIAAALIAGTAFWWMNAIPDRPGLAAAVKEIKSHPKVLAISRDLGTGHPLTRDIEGVWVSRMPSLWITAGILARRKREILDAETTAKLDRYAALDRAMLTEDIARGRPDVILVELREAFSWIAWAKADVTLAAELSHYREDRTVDNVLVLRRKEGS